MSKLIYDNNQSFTIGQVNPEKLLACYIPHLTLNYNELIYHLTNSVPFTRVYYISRFNKPNRTPRLTWAYGQINANKRNPSKTKECPFDSIPDPDAKLISDKVNYRGLNFQSEVMPDWIEKLSLYLRAISIQMFGFDGNYNSVIIGKYEGGEDAINFHTDDKSFLAHTFCANVTIGAERDFQFKTCNIDGTKTTHEIRLGHGSVFFFNGLEHALPARAKATGIRYSISFRNMATNVGIGNSFYYCRGLAGANNDNAKLIYQRDLQTMQMEKEQK